MAIKPLDKRTWFDTQLVSAVAVSRDLLDFFFILDGDLTMYLIPSRVLARRVMVL